MPEGADAIVESYFDADLRMAMNANHRFGAIAAVDAWIDAGFRRPDPGDDHVYWEAGAVIGTGVGGLDTVGERLVPMTDAGKVRRLGSTIVEQVMGSGVSARVSGLLALGNQVTSNSSACSTGTEAIVEGALRIRQGLAERMLCGGSEGNSHYSWAGFDAMRVLARQWNDEPEKASRPMSASAGGFVPGAGAGILHLESLDSALGARGPHPRRAPGRRPQLRGPPRRRQHDRPQPAERAPLHQRRASRRGPRVRAPSTRSTATSPPPAPTPTRWRPGRRPSSAPRTTCRRSPRPSR